LTKMIPTIIALTITMGIAPLLFIQVLYGQLFYPSSIVMAWPWLGVIILVMVAYYLTYLNSFKFSRLNVVKRAIISWSAVLLLAGVAFIYSNEMTLMVTPGRWATAYFADSSGLNLNLGEPMLFPRYLHFINGAMAVAAMFVAMLGVFEKREKWFAKEALQYGARLFMTFTFIQYLLGVLWLISLPQKMMALFMGRSILASILLLLSIVLSVGAILMLSKAANAERPTRRVISSMISLLFTIVFMAKLRDILRDAYLSPNFNLETAPSSFQASTIIPFLILLVGGLLTVFWMANKFFFPSSESQSAK